MDTAYIREHVHGALLEALLATATSNPEDKVNFLGEYLINYVQKKHDIKRQEVEMKHMNELAKIEQIRELHDLKVIELKRQADQAKCKQFLSFLSNDLMKMSTKQEIMDSICTFASEHFSIPACYIAERKIMNDETQDVLEYISANPSQVSAVVGKVLTYSDDDDEDNIEKLDRKGVSFEAFKMNEKKEDAEDKLIDVDDDGKSKTESKVPQKTRPLIVENVMRDKRVKFFKTPQLGAFFAFPLEIQTTAHEGGCVKFVKEDEEVEDDDDDDDDDKEEEEEVNETDDTEMATQVDKSNKPQSHYPAYMSATEKKEFLFAADTIGAFRQFQVLSLLAFLSVLTLVYYSILFSLLIY